MSIVWSLKWLFDPATHHQEEGERHAEREQPRHTHAGDPPQFEVAGGQAASAAPAQRFRCRVCGYHSRGNAYCPQCLADTMVPAASDPDGA
jgi:rubrerythrin